MKGRRWALVPAGESIQVPSKKRKTFERWSQPSWEQAEGDLSLGHAQSPSRSHQWAFHFCGWEGTRASPPALPQEQGLAEVRNASGAAIWTLRWSFSPFLPGVCYFNSSFPHLSHQLITPGYPIFCMCCTEGWIWDSGVRWAEGHMQKIRCWSPQRQPSFLIALTTTATHLFEDNCTRPLYHLSDI